MKVLQFTIPVPSNKTFIVQKEVLPHFYPHLHRHNEIQLVWVIKGEGTLVVDNNMHAFRSNDIFWLSENQPHLFKSDPSYFLPKSKKKIIALTVFFNPTGPLAAFFDFPELKNIKAFIEQHPSGFRLPAPQVARVSGLMEELYKTKGIDQFMLFIDLLKNIAHHRQPEPLSQNTLLNAYSENEGIRIGHIYHFVMHHYDQPISLEDVARQAHMTRQAFCRFFKKHTLLTFVSFLNQVRINEACKKLTGGSYESIATVAYQCGFNSIANFNRVFKETTGESPSGYTESYFRNVERG
jgi:AraC-like DNA-binding protein